MRGGMTMNGHELWYETTTMWMVFSIYFAISVHRLAVKRKVSVPVASLERCGLLLGMLLVFFPKTHLSFLAGRFSNSRVVATVGLCVVVAGLAFATWARDVLGRNWSAGAVIQVHHELVTAGPYAYVRHPLYTGLIVALAGTALVSGEYGALLGWVLLTSVFRMKARREERLLEGEFGSGYAAYCRRTGRLLPRFEHV
jgi:protein-S-isoprenylcysteine O-methyltransferase Ste14